MINPVDIVDIIQNPILIKDNFIRSGSVMLDTMGRPMSYAGGFAIVFPFMVRNEKWAFRCWFNDVGDVSNKLKLLSKRLDKLNLPYFCNFKYEDSGIVIDGKISPTTRMKWIEGLNIKDYMCKYAGDKNRLLKLAASFWQMCEDLHKACISHGDLQHGNILVDDAGKLFLIDYDSIFLPEMKGERDIIVGLPSYQHPSRIQHRNIYAHEKLDYFSELVIYISILAVATNPSLVKRFNLEDREGLLFDKEDFEDLQASKVYREVEPMGGVMKKLFMVLMKYLRTSNIVDMEPMERYVSTKKNTNYCHICGQKFIEKNDSYCFRCGTKKIEYVF